MSRTKQRIGGLILASLGAGLTAWTWYTAEREGQFSIKASLLFPAVLIVGLGLCIFPGYREERTTRGEDISGMRGLELLTVRWWVILVVALIAAGANYVLLSSW